VSFEEREHKTRRLYKYRPDNRHTLDIIKHQELYFSFAEEFNDPFDSRVVVAHFSGDEIQWRANAERFDIPENLKREAMKALESLKFNSEKLREAYEKHEFRTFIVHCMSEIRDNILMWGHYTNCHRGVCLGFETSTHRNTLCIQMNDPRLDAFLEGTYVNFLPVLEVKYQCEYPEPYDIFEGRTDDLIGFLTTKGKDWKYEQERRLILPYAEINTRVLHYDRSALKEVILGRNMTDIFKNDIISLLRSEYKAKGLKVDVFQSELDDREYKLNMKQINI
jgi:hypothetical protein